MSHQFSPIENALKSGVKEYWNHRNRKMHELTTSHIMESLYQLIINNCHILPLSTLNTILMRTWHFIPNDEIKAPERHYFWLCLTELYNLGLGENLFIEQLKKHGYTYPLDEKDYLDYFKTVSNSMAFAETWSNKILLIDENQAIIKKHFEDLKWKYTHDISSYHYYNQNRPNRKVAEIHPLFKDALLWDGCVPFMHQFGDNGLIIARYNEKIVLIDGGILRDLCDKPHGDMTKEVDKSKFWETIYNNRFSEIGEKDYEDLRKDHVMLAVWC